MKLTVEEYLDIYEALSYIGKMEGVICNYPIAKNIKKLQSIVKNFQNEKRKLIHKYVLQNEDGSYKIDNKVYVFGKNQQIFDESLLKLLEEKKEIQFHLIRKDELKSHEGKDIRLPANTLAALDDVILVDKIVR